MAELVDALVSNTSGETHAGSIPAPGIFFQSMERFSYSPKVKIAVQKSGRLHDDSMRLLKDCGFKVAISSKVLRAISKNFPIEVLFMRDDDIPEYVEQGISDIGIVGQNIIEEAPNLEVSVLKLLGFSTCRLSIAVKKEFPYSSIESLNGKKIATSYPNVLKRYLAEKNISCEIHKLTGGVEIAPNIGLADAICDLVSTGSTLVSNNLTEKDVILRSQAVLISTKRELQKEKKEIIDNILFRMNAVLQGRNHKYLVMNIPNEKISLATELLPGNTSPTIIPLADQKWSALHVVVTENTFWDVVEELKAMGAKGIMTSQVEKMIP